MRAIFLIARKDLRLLLRDGMALFWVFVFPIGFALFFGSIMKLVSALAFGVTIAEPLKYLVVLLACTLCFTGLMMSLSVLGRTEQAVSGAGWSSLIVLAMIGGAMVPPSVMPDWLLRLSNLSPVKWGIWALEGATWRAFQWSELVQPLVMLAAFGLASFAAGVAVMTLWREL